MSSKYKTTAKDFALFKKTCLEWIDRFGLGRWSITFKHKLCDGPQKAGAIYNVCDRWIEFYLAREWGHKPTRAEIKKSAVHEVTHQLISRLVDKAYSRFISESEIEEEMEAVCKAMENAIYGR